MNKIQNPMDVALSAIPNTSKVVETTEKKSTKLESGWGSLPVSTRLTYHTKKNIDDWTQSDLQYYLKNLYSDKYASTLHIPIANGHNWIKVIKFAMSKKLGIKEEPKHSMVKDYFDFCFEYHVDEIIRRDGNFSLYKLTKPKYLMDYFDKKGIQTLTMVITLQTKSVEASESVEALTIEDLTTAYRINPQYMVSNYGIVIPVNYLICTKGKTLDEAVSYVQGAMVKLATKGQQEMALAIQSTNKYQPYPSWLRFLDVAKIVNMTIAISDESPIFSGLMEFKQK